MLAVILFFNLSSFVVVVIVGFIWFALQDFWGLLFWGFFKGSSSCCQTYKVSIDKKVVSHIAFKPIDES